MRWVAWLVLASGCDLVFQVTLPKEPVCPPEFSKLPSVLRSDLCSYSHSEGTNLAIADCASVGVFQAAIGEPLVAPAPIDVAPGQRLRHVHITPEGDRMLVTSSDLAGTTATLELYAFANGRWKPGTVLPIAPIAPDDYASPPSSVAVGRRLMLAHFDSGLGTTFTEWRDRGAAIEPVATYTQATLGVAGMDGPSLTPDGLRLVFHANRAAGEPVRIMYSERSSVDVPFTTAQPIDVAIDNPLFPFLTDDCAQLYVAGADQLAVLTQ